MGELFRKSTAGPLATPTWSRQPVIYGKVGVVIVIVILAILLLPKRSASASPAWGP